MNSTNTLAIVAVLTTALVIGATLAATSAPSAFAINGSNDGNGVKEQKNIQKASQSGPDNSSNEKDTKFMCTNPRSGCERD